MSEDNNEEIAMIRKVYMLPKELVDRIGSFQQDKRLPSEVEAVRRLLDEALKYRDTPLLIVDRIKDRLKASGLIHSVGNDVLREHPLVAVIDQGDPDYIKFTMKDGRAFRVKIDGKSEVQDTSHNGYDESWDAFPRKPKQIESVYGNSNENPYGTSNDDDLPF